MTTYVSHKPATSAETADLGAALRTECMREFPDVANALTLIDNGADLDEQDSSGNTALMWACLRGHTLIARELIESGADVDVADMFGNTALIMSADCAREESTLLLIENGADVNAVDFVGNTALMYASKNGLFTTVMALLAKDANADLQNQSKMTARDYAEAKGHVAIADLVKETEGRNQPTRAALAMQEFKTTSPY